MRRPNSSLILCRCEEVTVGQLEQAYVSGSVTPRQLKLKTRATMGACQGRICRRLILSWMESKAPRAQFDTEQLSCRVPIRPVTFGQLAEGSEDE